MAKISEIGPGTAVGKQILEQFLNWEKTNFKPWGKNVGGANHYNSSAAYRVVSASAFRSQAKKIARIALEQLMAKEETRLAATNAGLKLTAQELGKAVATDPKISVAEIETAMEKIAEQDDDDESLPIDSAKRNPWLRNDQDESASEDISVQDDNESSDENYSINEDDSSSDDSLPAEEYDAIRLGELQISRTPFITEYPSGDKLLAIFPLDGNVSDSQSIQFEFIEDNTAIRRWGKIPKERENCVAMIGLGTEKPSKMGFSDPDLMVVDAEIKKRLKANNYQRDENGDIWELRATLQLPFQCQPQFYTRDGKALKSFRMRNNGRGFSWGFFWLLAWTPQKPKPQKRIGGKLVTVITEEDSSIYTERTYKSSKLQKK
jgi:hypothetical protein